MRKIYFDGLGNPYIIPIEKKMSKRNGVYAIVYIKDIDSFMLTVPMPHINEDHFKMAGGGIERSENKGQALQRELIEETGFGLNDSFEMIEKISYEFNFKPAKITDEYWLQRNTYYLYAVDTLEESKYPSKKWISEEEKITCVLLEKEYLKTKPSRIHFAQRMAFKYFVEKLDNEKIMHLDGDERIS
jgi:8-oxo-dGTP pyrophosphatase MutT (NUDIX family)